MEDLRVCSSNRETDRKANPQIIEVAFVELTATESFGVTIGYIPKFSFFFDIYFYQGFVLMEGDGVSE